MGELRGYTCDGGCGATTVLDSIGDSLSRVGWFYVITPAGMPTLTACSPECTVRAIQRVSQRALPT